MPEVLMFVNNVQSRHPAVESEVFAVSALSRAFALWEKMLETDIDAEFILDCLSKGATLLPDDTLMTAALCTNYSPSIAQPAKNFLDALFRTELDENKISAQPLEK
ncbi:MAG: hypothetical protein GY696_24945 [Gammaproteobacteria bacterium]|nr:hypothetical protein [Gammaproteobacteria bacterium]